MHGAGPCRAHSDHVESTEAFLSTTAELQSTGHRKKCRRVAVASPQPQGAQKTQSAGPRFPQGNQLVLARSLQPNRSTHSSPSRLTLSYTASPSQFGSPDKPLGRSLRGHREGWARGQRNVKVQILGQQCSLFLAVGFWLCSCPATAREPALSHTGAAGQGWQSTLKPGNPSVPGKCHCMLFAPTHVSGAGSGEQALVFSCCLRTAGPRSLLHRNSWLLSAPTSMVSREDG